MMVPFASGVSTRTTNRTEPSPPAASARIDQVTTPAESAPPPVADTNVVLTGTVSESTTPVAPEFPRSEERRVGKEGRPRATRDRASDNRRASTRGEVPGGVVALPDKCAVPKHR